MRAQRRGGAMLAELEKGHGGDRKSDQFTHVGKLITPYKEVLDTAELSYKKAAKWEGGAGV